MSLSKLSKLPPEVLSCVLNNEAIPLSRRLRLRLLCNRWADIIEDGLKKESSLVVCDESASYLKPNPDEFILKSTALTAEFPRPLSRLFTSLTKLTLDFGLEALKAVPSLLAHLDTTNSLTAVELYSGVVFRNEQINAIAIAASLTGLSRLTSLNLDDNGFSVLLLPHLWPLLSRLEKLCCIDYSFALGDLISSFPPPRFTHLQLSSYAFERFASPFLVELSRNLTHLYLHYCDDPTWQSISQMHGLASLELDFTDNCSERLTPQYLDSSLFRQLTPFSRLAQVKFHCLKYGTPLALPSKKEKPLSSIKRLTLQVDFGDSPVDCPAFFRAISAWFPNLGKLTIATKRRTPALQASLGQLPFSAEILDSVYIWAEDW